MQHVYTSQAQQSTKQQYTDGYRLLSADMQQPGTEVLTDAVFY